MHSFALDHRDAVARLMGRVEVALQMSLPILTLPLMLFGQMSVTTTPSNR
jgi:hypothetical protein